jgi:hypothetical protein
MRQRPSDSRRSRRARPHLPESVEPTNNAFERALSPRSFGGRSASPPTASAVEARQPVRRANPDMVTTLKQGMPSYGSTSKAMKRALRHFGGGTPATGPGDRPGDGRKGRVLPPPVGRPGPEASPPTSRLLESRDAEEMGTGTGCDPRVAPPSGSLSTTSSHGSSTKCVTGPCAGI